MGKLITFIVACLSTVLYAFTFMTLFNWFISPFGLPVLTMLQAYGVSMVITFLTSRVKQKDVEDNEDNGNSDIAIGITKSLIYLLVGYLVHLAM